MDITSKRKVHPTKPVPWGVGGYHLKTEGTSNCSSPLETWLYVVRHPKIKGTSNLASTAALTSCDKGSDEPDPGLEWQEGGYKYVEPCLQWGASTSQVKSWMDSNTQDFKLMSDIPDGMLMYNRNTPSTQLQYIFGIGHPGLMDVTITYNSIEGFQDVKSKTEKTYNCKLLQNPDNPEHYEAEGVIINGKKTCIDIIVKKIPQFPTSGIVTIKYSLDD